MKSRKRFRKNFWCTPDKVIRYDEARSLMQKSIRRSKTDWALYAAYQMFMHDKHRFAGKHGNIMSRLLITSVEDMYASPESVLVVYTLQEDYNDSQRSFAPFAKAIKYMADPKHPKSRLIDHALIWVRSYSKMYPLEPECPADEAVINTCWRVQRGTFEFPTYDDSRQNLLAGVYEDVSRQFTFESVKMMMAVAAVLLPYYHSEYNFDIVSKDLLGTEFSVELDIPEWSSAEEERISSMSVDESEWFEWAVDKHTVRGRELGRGMAHFWRHGIVLDPEGLRDHFRGYCDYAYA